MSDNPQVDPGEIPSVAVAADDCENIFYQRVKLTDGTADATTPIAAGGGVEAGALRVTVASDSTGVLSIDDNGGAITVDGTVAVTNADLASIKTAVEIIDNCISGSEAQVDVVSMPTVTVNAHAVTVASGGVASGAVASGALAAGAIADGADVTLGAKSDAKSAATDGTAVTVMQVLKQISASVQAPPSQAVTNAGTFAVQAVLAAGTAEIGKLAAGTAGIGKLTANSGVDIGDVDVLSVVPGTNATNLGKAEDAAHSSGDVGVMALAVMKTTPVATAAADDYHPLETDSEGKLWVNARQGTTWAAFHDVAGGAHADVALQSAPGANLSLYVTDIVITNDATLATSVKLEEDTASAKTALTPIMYVPASGGIVINYVTPKKLTANKDLGFTTTGTANTSIEVRGFTAA